MIALLMVGSMANFHKYDDQQAACRKSTSLQLIHQSTGQNDEVVSTMTLDCPKLTIVEIVLSRKISIA